MAEASDFRSIADRCGEIRRNLVKLLSETRASEAAPVSTETVEDVIDRFKLWTGNLGALHQPQKRMSLESRLADSPEVRNQICEQLSDLQEALEDLLTTCFESVAESEASVDIEDEQETTASDDISAGDLEPHTEDTSKEKASLILDMVSQCIKALFRIGILVRKASPRDRFERALQQSDFSFPAQFDTDYVEERYPKLRFKDMGFLASRLGGANAKRRQFIHYVRDHKARLEAAQDVHTMAYAITEKQSSKATTFVIPGDLSTFDRLDPSSLEKEDDLVSLVSASTAFDNERSLKLPSLAELSPDGEPFECPICFTLQSFRKEKSWKIHAYRDLKAYVCTYNEKQCESIMFGDRDAWFNHELEHHHSVYICKLCGCQCVTTALLEQHILLQHGSYAIEEISSVVEHGRIVPSQLRAQDCPFCDDWASVLSHRRHQADSRTLPQEHQAELLVSQTQFKRHVATHQEQLAIFSIPKAQVDNDEERSHGTVSSNSLAVSSKEISQGAPEVTVSPSYPAFAELSSTRLLLRGLPPGVTKADIENHFTGYGTISEIKLSGHGFGFVEYNYSNDAHDVAAALDGSILMGKPIEIHFAQVSFDRETGTYLDVDPAPEDLDISDAPSIPEVSRVSLTDIEETDELAKDSDQQSWNQKAFEHRSMFMSYDEMDELIEEAKRIGIEDDNDHFIHYIERLTQSLVWNHRAEQAIEADVVDYQRLETLSEEASSNLLAVSPDTLKKVDQLCRLHKRREEFSQQWHGKTLSSMSEQDTKKKPQYAHGERVIHETSDWMRVKVYERRHNDWSSRGTGFCTTNDIKVRDVWAEGRLTVYSEENLKHVLLETRVYASNSFQKQQDRVIIWTDPHTLILTAVSFQEAADCDFVWNFIEKALHRMGDKAMEPAAALPRRAASPAIPLTPIFACPFYRHDPIRYQSCLNVMLLRIKDVKQHLLRRHMRPPYCPRCYHVCTTDAELTEHLQSPEDCQEDTENECPEGVTRAQAMAFKIKFPVGSEGATQWKMIWDIIFPGRHKIETPSPFFDDA